MEGKEPAAKEGKEGKEGKTEEYSCTFPGCTKVLTTKSGLRYHLKTHNKPTSDQQQDAATPSQSQPPSASQQAQTGKSQAPLGEELLDQKKQELRDALFVKGLLSEKSTVFKGRFSRATLACYILSELIEDITVDLCADMYRQAKLEPAAFVATKLPDDKAQTDIYGQIPNVNNIQFDCPHCKRPIGGAKFATHLEKCMGISRSARAKNSNTEKNEIFDLLGDFEDDDDHDATYTSTENKKRKKPGPKPSKNKKKKTGPSSPSSPEASPAPPTPAQPAAAAATSSNVIQSPVASTPVSSTKIKIPHERQVMKHAEALLQQYTLEELRNMLAGCCGAISSSSGKICSKKTCTVHSEDQKQHSRRVLLKEEGGTLDLSID